MACNDCLENCGGQETSDQCVTYTGDTISSLGICPGDRISKVTSIILTALQSALDGTGILISDITLGNCTWLQEQFVGQSPTLTNLINLLAQGECSLLTMIENINTQISGSTTGGVFDIRCLTGLPSNPTQQQILQALLTQYCTTASTVASFPSTYVTLSDLPGQVAQILSNSGVTGGTVQYANYFPPGIAMPYFGSVGNFDNTGKGLASAGLLGMYLCNGNNGTPDIRGRAVVGAIRNVPGGQPDSAVDPSLPGNPNMNYALGDKFGEGYHLLLLAELAAHTHPVVDPGHQHTAQIGTVSKGYTGTNPVLDIVNLLGFYVFQTQTATTGLTVGSAGGNSPHNNVQPSIAAYWIIRL